LTTPFEPAWSGEGSGGEFVALYLFDAEGNLVDARIQDFGPRSTLDDQQRRSVYEEWLHSLGKVEFGRIEVAPFVVERFRTKFGLIPREPEDEDDQWVVEMQPGNYMAFYEPWDSGDYDT
jgi:hypothetical protein